MAKYIIDVPKEWVDITNGLHIPIENCGNVGNLRIDTGLKLIPYTESDEEVLEKATHEGWLVGKKEGAEEAWDFATSCIDMDGNDFCSCFEDDSVYCLTECTYSEAKSKYDEWKRKNEEIHVGDEVKITEGGSLCVVCGIVGKTANLIFEKGDLGQFHVDKLIRTGRHFDEVEELLKKFEEK